MRLIHLVEYKVDRAKIWPAIIAVLSLARLMSHYSPVDNIYISFCIVFVLCIIYTHLRIYKHLNGTMFIFILVDVLFNCFRFYFCFCALFPCLIFLFVQRFVDLEIH